MPPTIKPPVVESNFYPTFFLCLFLGGFGAHRFYTGKIKSGIAQLVTLGGCGIWPVVDLITILLGRFKDKNGVQMPNANPKLTWPIFVITLAFCGCPISIGALSLAAQNGLFGKGLADSIAKANAESQAAVAKAKAAEAKEDFVKVRNNAKTDYRGEYTESPKPDLKTIRNGGRTIKVDANSIQISEWIDGDYYESSGKIDDTTTSTDGKTVTVTGKLEYSTLLANPSRDGTVTSGEEGRWTTPFTGTINTAEQTITFKGALIIDSLKTHPWDVTLTSSSAVPAQRAVKQSVEPSPLKLTYKTETSSSSGWAGMEVAKLVWKTARKNPKAKSIEVTVELDSELTDTYGKVVPGPHIMGTITETDLDEVRKYVSADAYAAPLGGGGTYGFSIHNMTYGWLLRKD
jgi:TM2 domain-containing membrane protein YozV